MLNKKQYVRLTMVLLLPLLGLGWWLAENEIIGPNNHIILCREHSTVIDCMVRQEPEEDKSPLVYGQTSVRLAGAVLTSSFNHPVEIVGRGGCKNFCVNGQLAGNCCTPMEMQINDRHERTDRQPAG